MPEKLAELAGAAEGPAAAADGWHELAVANPTFSLERLGSECTDLQGLRELTPSTGWTRSRRSARTAPAGWVWDLDWERFDGSGGRVRKLSVIDTGTGMTAGQLRHYINQLAASGREQSSRGNFGVGAKVAAGSRKPNADFRAISDLANHWRDRYRGVPVAQTVIEAQVREWCAQVLVEVVLAVRSSDWNEDRPDALLPRHPLHATLQKRLAQRLGPPRSEPARHSSRAGDARRRGTRSRGLRELDGSEYEWQQAAAPVGGWARPHPMSPGSENAPA